MCIYTISLKGEYVMWENIKKVLIYLRKSRGDEEDALEKHRTRLVSMTGR